MLSLVSQVAATAAVTAVCACATYQRIVFFIAKEPICPASILDWISTIT